MTTPNDMQRISDGLAKLEASNPNYDGTKRLAARRLIRKTYKLADLAVDSATSSTLAATAAPGIRMPVAGRVLGATFIARGTTTIDALGANYATIAVNKLAGAGAAGAVIATKDVRDTGNSGTGNLAAGTFYALVVDTNQSNARYTAGMVLAPSITKTGAGGLTTAASSWCVDVEEEDSEDGYRVG